MVKILTALFFLWRSACLAQIHSAPDQSEYYGNGKLKTLFATNGKDTIEIKKFYKSGRLRDSIWVYLTEKDEVPFGTSKSYHENGQLAIITHYVKGNEQYISYEYTSKGKLKRFEQRPSGLTKMYNRKGVQVVEYDYHKLKDVFVPLQFQNNKHLKNTRFENRIKTKEALLTDGSDEKKFIAGSLITVQLRKDTLKRSHCLVEGFSHDTIFLSDFHYNELYERGTDIDILKFDSTFAVPVKDLRNIVYARHKTKKRVKTAALSTVIGAELILLPIVPLAVLPFIGYEALTALKLYAAFAVPGTGLFFLGKYFFKTAVPKPYDLNKYRITIKS
jgi:hypothetical protein